MSCNKTEDLIMRYMDGSISEMEAVKLNEHISECELCREEFQAYDEVMALFLESELEEAPPEFEERVMARIACLTPNYVRGPKWTLNNVSGTLWGIYCILFGFGVMAVMYRDAVLEFISKNPSAASVVSVLYPIRDRFVQLTSEFTQMFEQLAVTFNTYAAQSRVFVLTVLGIIIAMQVVIYVKNKDKAEAE